MEDNRVDIANTPIWLHTEKYAKEAIQCKTKEILNTLKNAEGFDFPAKVLAKLKGHAEYIKAMEEILGIPAEVNKKNKLVEEKNKKDK